LKIEGVRNLERVRLDTLTRVNFFHGPNGAGKTSLLEAVHLLGMGRSFRRGSFSNLIQHGREDTVVFGRVRCGSGAARSMDIGVRRYRDGTLEMRVEGRPAAALSELVVNLPLQVVNAEANELLTGTPAVRRRFMDWGVFHVEHQFHGQWRRYQRGLRQRNHLLRRGNPPQRELAVWTREVIEAGEALTAMRSGDVDALKPAIQYIMGVLHPGLKDLGLSYRKGWDSKHSYGEALEQGLQTDLERHFTYAGPHRADMRLTTDGYPVGEVLSRGQQKILVYGLKLAQGGLLRERTGRDCTYLIDDLPSELDEKHGRRVCALLDEIGAQVLVTCIDTGSTAWWPDSGKPEERSMFHVEHGVVTQSYR